MTSCVTADKYSSSYKRILNLRQFYIVCLPTKEKFPPKEGIPDLVIKPHS